MNKERGRAWVAALRSGKFLQGDGMLKDAVGYTDDKAHYCCLGVASELACEAGIVEQIATLGGAYRFVDKDVDYDTYLPPVVADWLGVDQDHLGDRDGAVDIYVTVPLEGRGEVRMSLSALNDEGNSFDLIADYIEAEFKLNEED